MRYERFPAGAEKLEFQFCCLDVDKGKKNLAMAYQGVDLAGGNPRLGCPNRGTHMSFYVCKICGLHMRHRCRQQDPHSIAVARCHSRNTIKKQILSTPPTRTRTSEGCRRKRPPGYADAFTSFQAQPPYCSCAELRSINNIAVTQPGAL